MRKTATFSIFLVVFLRGAYSFSTPSARTTVRLQTSLQAVKFRDWVPGEGEAILEILQSAEDGSFDPEGSLDQDCTSEFLLSESYDPEDGGCFIVAELENNLVGVAGMIVGTPVEYQASGASVSSAQTTAAIRRCCCRLPGKAATAVIVQQFTTLEERAQQAKATKIIALAYPPTNIGNSATQKPTPQLLEALGYKMLPQQLPGVNALQYGKDLPKKNNNESTASNSASNEQNGNDLAGSFLAMGTLGILLAGFYTISQFIGFDINMSPAFSAREMDSINRGLGRPLSSEDLGQLIQDENLQRITLDGDSLTSSGREWNDLSPEEQREEMALLGIISGQDVRIK